MKQSILMIENDPEVISVNSSILKKQGYRVMVAETLNEGKTMLENDPDLMMLDITMPDGNGLDFCSEVRKVDNIPIILLHAQGDDQDVIEGLACGADDYLSKPYDLGVLCARVEALLRRSMASRRHPQIISKAGLKLDTTSGLVTLDNEDLKLTHKERSILEYLLRNQYRHVSAQELYSRLWGMDSAEDMRTIWAHVSRLRKKFGNGASIDIVSQRRKGYKIIEK